MAIRVSVAQSAEATAAVVALDYLKRAGVRTAQEGDIAFELSLPDPAMVSAVAGRMELREASASLLGAFAAVEAIKQATSAGSKGSFPADFVLAEET